MTSIITRFSSFLCKSKVPASNRSTRSFGIIAALNKQNLIGINGSLPWKHLPQDKAHFVNTTRDKVLIIGRKSFAEENSTGSHVEHVRACIVLSNSMEDDELTMLKEKRGGPELRLARSFEEALYIASELKSTHFNPADISMQRMDNGIDCWVAGGTRIYEEALQHKHLQEVSLTNVDVDIDGDLELFEKSNRVAFFPIDVNVFNKREFQEVSRSVDGVCTFVVYRRSVAK
jgi:dihydrofolate reductase